MTLTPLTYQKCSLHELKRDRLLGPLDHHHVIPVSWQKFYIDPEPQYPGPDPEGRGELWDNRTVALAPTCHRNVHFWIVTHMHAMAKLGSGATVEQAEAAVAKEYGNAATRLPELGVAIAGLQRFTDEAKGDLYALTTLGQWGQA